MKKVVPSFIVLMYLLVGALYAVKTPDWQVPDEPAHYNYIRQLVEEKRLPVLALGDYEQDYLERLKSQRFPPDLSIDTVEYEDHQPPLYYLLAAPIFLAFDGALAPVRLFSVLLGGGVVLMAYAVAITVFPNRPLVALGAAALVAFLPQHVAMMAGVNNDSLAELLIGLTLWMTVRWLRDQRRPSAEFAASGFVIGLGLVTKTTYVPVAAAVGAALLIWWRGADRAWRERLGDVALIFGPALFIALLWWLRNSALYGGFDIYGLANHDEIVVGQPRTVDWIQANGLRNWLERGLTFTFQSFWGQFGWMGVLMPTSWYRTLALATGALAIGFMDWLRRWRARKGKETRNADQEIQNRQLLFLAWTVLLVTLAFLYYNSSFVQHQGRYLFPALIPIGLGAALSICSWLRLLRMPQWVHPAVFVLWTLGLVGLDLYALWRFVLPALT